MRQLDAKREARLDDHGHESAQHLGCYCVRWTCVRTHPQAERWADSNLRHSGYQTYLPLYAVQRRDRVVPSLMHTVLAPLFAGYVFVQHDPNTSWGPIRDTPGVQSVLRCGNRIQYATAGAVEALQAAEAARRSLTPARAVWAPGAVCSPAVGVLAGYRAIVLRVTSTHAVVALMLLGALREVTLPLDSLAPAT